MTYNWNGRFIRKIMTLRINPYNILAKITSFLTLTDCYFWIGLTNTPAKFTVGCLLPYQFKQRIPNNVLMITNCKPPFLGQV